MKKLVFVFLFSAGFSTLFGQPFVAVHTTDSIRYYTSILDAIGNAVDNDTIYVPGGSFNIGTLNIDKILYIYGVGYFPDSTRATMPSNFLGNLRILTGADGGLLSGILVSGNVAFGTSSTNQVLHNYTISRCRITSYLYLSYNGTSRTNSTGIVISESVINNDLYGGYAPITLIKCILGRGFHYVENSLVKNSLFLYQGLSNDYYRNQSFYHVLNSVFENNIFTFNYNTFYSTNYVSGNQFINNLFRYNYNIDNTGNSGENNLLGLTPTFVNSTDINLYSTDFDFHLDEASAGKNAGSDGTDVGIYGTAFPFKHVPVNPHIFSKNIERQLSSDGTLDISVGVSAQDR